MKSAADIQNDLIQQALNNNRAKKPSFGSYVKKAPSRDHQEDVESGTFDTNPVTRFSNKNSSRGEHSSRRRPESIRSNESNGSQIINLATDRDGIRGMETKDSEGNKPEPTKPKKKSLPSSPTSIDLEKQLAKVKR